MGTETVVAASVFIGTNSADISKSPDLPGDFDPGPGKPFPGSGDILEMPDFVSAIDPGPRKPSLESGNILELPAFIGDSGPGKLSLEPGDMFPDITQFPGLAPLNSDVAEV